jgi:hypothetical protein
MTDNRYSSLAQFLLGNSSLTPDPQKQTQAGSTTILTNENQNSLVYQGTDGLCFQGVSLIPLSELHDFSNKCPVLPLLRVSNSDYK